MDDARPLLTRLRAENVRSFATLDLELGPLTVLVGPNGAGKSNVVSILRFIRDAVRAGVGVAIMHQLGWNAFCRIDCENACVEPSLVLGRDGYDLAEISVKWNLSDENTKWGQIMSGVARRNPSVASEVYRDAEDREKVSGPSDGVDIYNRVKPFLVQISIFKIESSGLRDRVQRTDTNPSLQEDLSNLGSVLLGIRETPLGDKIDRALALLVDGVTGYAVAQAGSTLVPQILYGPDDARDLGLESDGTIRLVALLAAMYQPVSPSILVLEEPEMGLHPGVLSALAEFITEASRRMQVVVTTHSPDLIDCFDLDSLRVVEKIDGETRIGPVRPQQREAVRKHLFTPSEIMRMEGLQLDLG